MHRFRRRRRARFVLWGGRPGDIQIGSAADREIQARLNAFETALREVAALAALTATPRHYFGAL